jgi:hypothetical protein
MFNSSILDVAIGLVFVFLTLSLICSAAKEIIEAGLRKRSKDLEKGIRELVGCAQPPANPAAAADKSATPNIGSQPPEDFVKDLYNHGLINALFKGKYKDAKASGDLPSYIPAANFALTVLSLRDSYKDAKKDLPQNLQDALTAFEKKADGKADVLQRELEDWFNSAMDRVSGWYKRRTQTILLALGFVVAVAVNADAIGIAHRLWTDTNFRESLVAMASAAVNPPASQGQPAPKPSGQGAGGANADKGGATKSPGAGGGGSSDSSANPGQDKSGGTAGGSSSQAAPAGGQPESGSGASGGNGSGSDTAGPGTDTDAAVKKITDNLATLDRVSLPLGWNVNTITSPLDFLFRLIGWLITALAVSLGAPFWFDILNKVMVVRSTIKPGEKSGQGTKK